MGFQEDWEPLVTGPWLRGLSLWVNIVVFALALLTALHIFPLAIFALTFFVAILDLVLVVRRAKLRKNARLLGQKYVFQPNVWVISLDAFFGVAYLVLFAFCLLRRIHPSTHYFARHYNIFGVFVTVGTLTIAHLHIFFASFELHIRRQLKSGQRASMRMESRERAKDDAGLELGQSPTPLQ